ncbi:YesL family protein [Georgenia halophila]|uniref:YesL family protein n=1 Tax=Georgenia halophila TaxID=620889 RepID=A0ABP8LG70_9MICO
MLQGLVTSGTAWVSRLALLNLLWLAASLAGLGVFGVFPATLAAFQLVRDWRHRPKSAEQPYVRRYLKLVLDRAASGNLWGYGVLAVGYVIYVGISVAATADYLALRIPVLGLLIAAGMALLSVVVHLPFMLAHVEASWRHLIRASLFYGFTHPLGTMLVVASGLALSFVFGRWPALAFFFTISPMVMLTVSIDLVGYQKLQYRATAASR